MQKGGKSKLEGEWKLVNRNQVRRATGKWDILKNGKGKVQGPSTTFFFTYFVESWSAKDLFFEFKELGEIDEIVISSKSDWRGKKYGFVKFVKMVDERMVEAKLNNIWMDGRKIITNISKYKRRAVANPSNFHGDLKKVAFRVHMSV